MDGEDADWFRSVRIDLEHEPSAVASAAFEAAPLGIFDVESSPRVNRRLADRVGAKSAAFVPVVSGARVLAVLIAASTNRRRTFPPNEIARLEALAGETGSALEDPLCGTARGGARSERLVAEIARRVRSGMTSGGAPHRRRGGRQGHRRLRAASSASASPARPRRSRRVGSEGLPPIGVDAPNLAVSNLAMRERKTVAVEDVEEEPKLEDRASAAWTRCSGCARAALATPIQVFDRMIGVFALHCSEPTEWTQSRALLAEAVAREVGLALHGGAARGKPAPAGQAGAWFRPLRS